MRLRHKLMMCMNTRQELGLHAQTLGSVLNRGADAQGSAQILHRVDKAFARGSYLSQVIDRGAKAAARDTDPCASQVLYCGAEAVTRCAACCVWPVLDRGARAAAKTATCGDKTLPQQEKNTRQMSRRTE
jgi:hypothetical protein